MKLLWMWVLAWTLLTGAASRSFDGTDDEIDMGNVLNVTTGNVSLCAWWKGTEDASADVILGKRASSASATVAGYSLHVASTDTGRTQMADGTTGVDSSSTDQDGAWFWDCGTWDGTNNISVYYVNGVQGDTDTASIGSLTTTANLQFGEFDDNSSDAAGLIAYGMVYGTALLTVNEVNELFWFPERIPTAIDGGGKGGFWPLWGASTEQDLSGNGLTGTVSNASTSQDGPPVMFGEGLPL